MNVTSQVSLPALENYSLLKKPTAGSQKRSSADQEMAEINDLDSGKQEIVVEEPGFAEAEEVNHDDLEDTEDLPECSSTRISKFLSASLYYSSSMDTMAW